jgi:large subunit ribosomal protein L10
MKKKADKKRDIDSLHGDLEHVQNLFVTGYEKLRVSQDFELRKVVRGAGAKYRVVKNNLADVASEGTPSEQVLKGLRGMTSTFTFKAGMVEGRAIDVKSIQDLATLPSKEQILSKLLYLINAPAQRLLAAINGVGRNLAVVVDQGVKENKFGA